MIGVNAHKNVKVDLKDNVEFWGTLLDLFNGNAASFVRYVDENKITELDLSQVYNKQHENTAYDLSLNEIQMIFNALKGTNVNRVSLAHRQLGYENVTQLVRSLAGSKVNDLDLTGNFNAPAALVVSVKPATDLAQAIVDSNIDAVNFSDNQLLPNVVKGLINTLKQKSYKKLNFGHNLIGDFIINDLEGLDVQQLSLSQSAVSNTGAHDLAQWIKSNPVQKLDLTGNFRIGDEGVDSLIKALADSHIKSLPIHYSWVTKKIVSAVENRNIANYYHSNHGKLDIEKSKKKVQLTEKEKALKAGVEIMLNVPADVRRLIESDVTNQQGDYYRELRKRFHPQVSANAHNNKTIAQRAVTSAARSISKLTGLIKRS